MARKYKAKEFALENVKHLRDLMDLKGINQTQVAELVGVSSGAISNWLGKGEMPKSVSMACQYLLLRDEVDHGKQLEMDIDHLNSNLYVCTTEVTGHVERACPPPGVTLKTILTSRTSSMSLIQMLGEGSKVKCAEGYTKGLGGKEFSIDDVTVVGGKTSIHLED